MNKDNLLIILLGILFAVFFTFPFILYLDKYYVHLPDYMFFDWLFQYNYRSIVTGAILDIDKYFHSNQFYPFPYSLALADVILFPSLLIYTPIALLTQNTTFSLNFLIFFSFVLTFASAFFCLDYFIRHRFASLFAALVFTFSPVAFIRFVGHVEYLQRYFVPLIFLTAYIFLKKPTLKNGLFFFVIYFLSWLTNLQLTIFSSTLLIIFWLYFAFLNYEKGAFLQWVVKICKYSLLGIPLLIFLTYLYSPYLKLAKREGINRSLNFSAYYSATAIDFILGDPKSVLLGEQNKWLSQFAQKEEDGNVNYAEHSLSIGYLALFLFLVYWRSKKGSKYDNLFLLCFTLSVILSFGPYLKSAQNVLTEIKLPYFYLYDLFPLLQATRTPTRIMLVAIFFVSVFVGLSIKSFLKNSRRGKIIALLLLLLLLTEYKTRLPMYFDQSFFLDYSLTNKKVLFYPLADDAERNTFYLTKSVKNNFQMVNGHIGTLIDTNLYLQEKLNKNPLQSEWFEILKTLQLDFLILDLDQLKKNKALFSVVLSSLEQPDLEKIIKYRSDQWIVLDLTVLKSTSCVLTQQQDLSLELKLHRATYFPDNTYYLGLIYKNTSSCNLTFPYEKRYLPVSAKAYNQFSLPERFYLQLPVVLLKDSTLEGLHDKVFRLHKGEVLELETNGKKYFLHPDE